MIKKMRIYARTAHKSQWNNFKGEDWAEVTLSRAWFPSGYREVACFPSGGQYKTNVCEIVYVFDK